MLMNFSANLIHRFRTLFNHRYQEPIYGALPTIKINDEVSRNVQVFNGTLNDATSATILTTDAEKNFYVSSIQLSVASNGTSGMLKGTVQATVNGATIDLAVVRRLAAGSISNSNLYVSFPYPVKIDKNTAINITSNGNTTSFFVECVLTGFYEEDI